MNLFRKIILLSVNPQHAHKIFDGRKTIELRKKHPQLSQNDIVLVYSTAPEKCLTGYFEVKQVIKGTPDALWEKVFPSADTTKKEFDDYYKGIGEAQGIVIKNATRLAPPLSLDLLKTIWPGFVPPQNFRYFQQYQITPHHIKKYFSFLTKLSK